jgi:hypothetical protein
METHNSNARLSIYGMEDATAFVMGDGIGDTPAFVIKGDTPRETHVSFTCIIRDA